MIQPWNEAQTNAFRMPFLPKRLVFVFLPAVLCGCGNIEAQGPLKSVLGGKGPDRTLEEEEKYLETQRQVNQQIPPPNEDKGAVGFKIPL